MKNIDKEIKIKYFTILSVIKRYFKYFTISLIKLDRILSRKKLINFNFL